MDVSQSIESLYQHERDRILATLIGILRDFALAEEMMQEAFVVALAEWPVEGIPNNPRAWIVSTARFKAVDRLRRDVWLREALPHLQRLIQTEGEAMPAEAFDRGIPDDRLRLIFTCCHPALAAEGQIALTLRTLCGLTTEEIARVFLVSPSTMAQRLVRVQRKISEASIPYRVPPADLLPERLETVLATIYLIFTEGYAATSGNELVRKDLCAEAIRLGRLLLELMPGRNEPAALLALMLLHDSRRDARTDAAGDVVLLEQQDRSRWNQEQIKEGLTLVERCLRNGASKLRYALEASIAAVHAQAATSEETDWPQIAGLYQLLLQTHPSAVVELNQAVAISMAEGPEAGLQRLTEIERQGHLRDYHLLPAAQANLLQRLGRWDEAVDHYQRAVGLAGNEPERRFLEKRLAEAMRRRAPNTNVAS